MPHFERSGSTLWIYVPPGDHGHATKAPEALRARGYVVNIRQPDVVRLGPIAQYTSDVELWQAAQALREIIDT